MFHMRRFNLIAAGFLLVAGCARFLAAYPAAASSSTGELILLSTAADRSPANDSSSWPTVSASGEMIAFTSQASNLGLSDHNSASDIFLYNKQANSLDVISVSSEGELSNAASFQPSISADGRVIAFASLASNLVENDPNGLADIFIREMPKDKTDRISIGPEDIQPNGWSDQPSISGNGRYIAFRSKASNLVADDHNTVDDIFLYDRETDRMLRISNSDGNSSNPFISSDGRYIGYLSQSGRIPVLWMYDRITQKSRRINLPENKLTGIFNLGPPALSADGRYLAITAARNRSVTTYLYDASNNKLNSISSRRSSADTDMVPMKTSISSDGRWVAYESDNGISIYDRIYGSTDRLLINESPASEPAGYGWPVLSLDGLSLSFIDRSSPKTNVYSLAINQDENPSHLVAGWASDGLGHPLAGVTIFAGPDHQVLTEADGSFSFPANSSGNFIVTAEKKGYAFYPPSRPASAAPGGVVGLQFRGVPEGIVQEAFKDIGMPYSRFRACESPNQDCSGTFHGFYGGECTDLVMDAYTAGVEFNIQHALQRDYWDNPRHYYQWRDARNAHDMWRYFTYTGQVLPENEPYLLGDIVFFDWEKDGLVDHVAVISEVNSKGRPRKMIDATGVIADNPSGLATELIWKPYHASRTPGHARWLGNSTVKNSNSPTDIPILLVALDAPGVNMRLIDSHGRIATEGISQIPGSESFNTDLGQVVSIDRPEVDGSWIFIELTASEDTPYQLGIQTIDNREISAARVYQRRIASSETQLIPLQLKIVDQKLKFEIPIPLP